MSNVHIDAPGSPDDAEVEVFGLGVFKNKATHEVTEEDIARYEALTGLEWPEGGLTIPNPTVEPPEPTEDVEEVVMGDQEQTPVTDVTEVQPVTVDVPVEGTDN